MTAFLLFININGCRAGWRWTCLFPVCGWLEWPSSGVAVGFYDHESSWCCSLWRRICVWLRTVDCLPDPCTWWNTWPPDPLCFVHDPLCFVVAPIGNSDHSSLSTVISMAQAVPDLCGRKKGFLKYWVNFYTLYGAIQDPPWRANLFLWQSSWGSEQTSVPTCRTLGSNQRSSVCATRMSLGLIINAGVLLASCRRIVFGGPVIALRLTG